jgi:chromate transporter
MKTVTILADLFWTFFKIGAVTFGGGLAMLPILERELADKRHWTTGDELLDYYAIGQSTPGVIAVNVSTFIGYKQKGVIGSIVATAGIVTPSIIVITLIARFIGSFSDVIWVRKALAGINVAVAALLTNAVIRFARRTLRGIFAAVLLTASFIAIFVFKVNTLWIILASAVLGIIFAACSGHPVSAGSDEDDE